jgi:hypothetical protein
VEGTVTKGGRPLADLRVVFLADAEAGTQGPRASGITDQAGHYELRTDAGDRGAVVGRYRICLHIPLREEEDLSPQAKRPKAGAAKPPASEAAQLPPTYSSFANTPLRVEVQPEAQVIDLEVK